jgi:jumonji domain-containing protein 7
VSHWRALYHWNNDYLRAKLGHIEITVDITPNGYGDAVTPTPNGPRFVTPEERRMTFAEFLRIFKDPSFNGTPIKENNPLFGDLLFLSQGIPYIQHQNNNLWSEFVELLPDVESEGISWMTEAMGTPPDVVNFWMGDHRSVTSLHKGCLSLLSYQLFSEYSTKPTDHYENLYVVIAGEKHFTLFPPTDQFYMYECNFRKAHFRENATRDGFDVIDDEPETFVSWSVSIGCL